MTQQPTCMLCVGATKAGTSWLHRYISDHPQCYMRGIKELHYFDAVAFNAWDPWIKDLQARHDGNLREMDTVAPGHRAIKAQVARDAAEWLEVLRERQADDAAYLAYLQNGRTDQRLVGDMTPAYCLLPPERLSEMARIMPDVRIVYLLRDPVDRIWSHARMIAKRRALTQHEIGYRSVHILRRLLAGKEQAIVQRSDYVTAIRNLRAAVEPSKLKIIFYEELFTQSVIDDLCRFLGLDPHPANFGKRVLKGPEAEMEDGQYGQLRDFLAEQYDFIAETFGRIPARWRLKREGVA